MTRALALVASVVLVGACTGGASPSVAPTGTPAPQSAAPESVAPGSEAPESAAPSAVAGPGEPESTTLRIVQGSDPDFTQVALTKAIADMDAKGITVEFQATADSDVASRAVIAGQADVAVTFAYFGINAVKAGVPIKMFMADAQSVDYLMVTTSDIESMSDLVGQPVGINTPGDLGATVVDQCLKAEGVDPADVEFVSVGGTSARMAALLSGQTKGGVAHVAEAMNAVEESDGAVKIVANCGEAIGSFLQTGPTATDEWLAANPNLAQIWVDTYIDALRWAAEDKEGYIELSKEVVPDLRDDLRDPAYDLLKESGLFAVNGGLTPESVEKVVEIGIDSGALEEPIPDTWYTFDFIESYIARNGEQ